MGKEKHLNEGSNINGNSGNVFCFDAAILLFLENAKVCNYISTEDAEDIRLSFKNSEGDLFAQAKSSFKNKQLYDEDHFSEIFDSYESFQRAAKDKRNIAKEFSIVFNYRKPFGNGEIIFGPEIEKYKKYKFDDLSTNIQKRLIDRYNKKKYVFDIDKTSYTYIYYEGEETTRNHFIIEKITSFINDYDLDINPKSLYTSWFGMLSRSATHSKNMISKNHMVGAAFTTPIKQSDLLNASKDLFDNFYPFEESQLKKEISNYLANRELDFATITKIKSSFFRFCKERRFDGLKKKELYLEFANDYAINNDKPAIILGLFVGEKNKEEMQTAFYKIIIFYVINQQSTISVLEEAFGYEN